MTNVFEQAIEGEDAVHSDGAPQRSLPLCPRLRVGVIMSQRAWKTWERALLKRLTKSDDAELAMVLRYTLPNDGAAKTSTESTESVSYQLADRFDRFLWTRRADASVLAEEHSLSDSAHSFDAMAIRRGNALTFAAETLELLRSQNIDVLIPLDAVAINDEVLQTATRGAWRLCFGEDNAGLPAATGFWEVANDSPVTGVTLSAQLADDPSPITLCRSWSATFPYSPARNRSQLLWRGVTILTRELARLQALDAEEFWKRAARGAQEVQSPPTTMMGTPSGSRALKSTIQQAAKLLRKVARYSAHRGQWFLMWENNPELSLSPDRYKRLVPPKDRFWADPHLVRKDGAYYLFVEELTYARGRGHISVMTGDGVGQWSQPQIVLEKDCHLSNPFVFETGGVHYMIPETSWTRNVQLYESTSFPSQWKWSRNLLENVDAADAMVLCHDGRWWMFVNIAAGPGWSLNDELYLFHAKELQSSDWTPHPMNPVVSDVRQARGGGRPFEQDGRLFRPSQDCSREYGWGLNLNEILELSETTYRERCVSQLCPTWDSSIERTHTLAREGSVTVIDAYRRIRRF